MLMPEDCWTRPALFEVIACPQKVVAKHADSGFCWGKRNDVSYLHNFMEEVISDLETRPTYIVEHWNNCSMGNVAYWALYCTKKEKCRERMQNLYTQLLAMLSTYHPPKNHE